MRVVECNVCGETLAAVSNEELVRRLRSHTEQEHGQSYDEGEAREMIANEAYEATDS
jgi:predicted small metal-binding protein